MGDPRTAVHLATLLLSGWEHTITFSDDHKAFCRVTRNPGELRRLAHAAYHWLYNPNGPGRPYLRVDRGPQDMVDDYLAHLDGGYLDPTPWDEE